MLVLAKKFLQNLLKLLQTLLFQNDSFQGLSLAGAGFFSNFYNTYYSYKYRLHTQGEVSK